MKQSVSTTMAQRTWTPALATKSLPLVRQIARDILEDGRELKSLTERRVKSEEEDRGERDRRRDLARRLEGYMYELDEIGCRFRSRGFDSAQIDFPGEIEGRPVVFSWQLGEDRVEFYSDPEVPADRVRIPPDLLEETR